MDQQQYEEIVARLDRVESMLEHLISCLAEEAEDEETPRNALDGEDLGLPRNELESLG